MGTALGECWFMTGLERLSLLAGAYMALHAVQQVEEVERAGRQSQDVPEILQVFPMTQRLTHQHACTLG